MTSSRHTFPVLLQRFFTEYLTAQRNLSQHTVAAYRDTFRLLLRFLASRERVTIDRLSLGLLTPEPVLAFLDHLERGRNNGPRTRNCRLAAIRAFARFVISLAEPGAFPQGAQLLAIPVKRSPRPVLGFLTREEVEAILSVTDLTTWIGRRDHLLFVLLYNTGARISEALGVRRADVQNRAVRLHGKGRKERTVPIWSRTAAEFQRWCRENQLQSDEHVFLSADRTCLTRQGARLRLKHALRKAATRCSTLDGRRLGLHSFRHSCAMHLLQSGVALEVIALWLGHERPITTHGYVAADLKMKQESLRRLEDLPAPRRPKRDPSSRLLAFLEAI
jgi:integrase/recombinase XerD